MQKKLQKYVFNSRNLQNNSDNVVEINKKRKTIT